VRTSLNYISCWKRYGVVCEFEKQKAPQIIARLKGIFKAYKVNIDDITINYLIENCGTSLQDLINESRKLIEYAGQGETVTKGDIDNLCIKQMESIIFDLTDNLGKKNVAVAMQVLNNLIYSKEPIQKILMTLYNHFKKVYITKIAMKNNKDVASSLNLKPNQMFLVNKYRVQANSFKEEELKKVLEELIDLDYKYKIGQIDVNVGLETIICSIE